MKDEIRYTISEKDFINAYKLAAKASKKQKIWLGAGGIFLLLLGVLNSGNLRILGLFSLFAGIIGYYLTSLIIVPWQAKNHYRNYKSIQGQLCMRFGADGFILNTEDGSNYAKWEKILKWRENNSYLLIYLAPKLFYLVPKYSNDTKKFVQTMQKLLLKNIGSPD